MYQYKNAKIETSRQRGRQKTFYRCNVTKVDKRVQMIGFYTGHTAMERTDYLWQPLKGTVKGG